MTLDLFSVSVMTTVVVVASSVVFILGSILRRDDGAGRMWGLAFLAAVLTSVSYLVWSAAPEAWWAIAIGNGAFVAIPGCIWLGCRAYNTRRMLVAGLVVAATAVVAIGAVVVAGPEGGGWAGAPVMFVGILIFAALGAVESLRGDMGRNRNAWSLVAVLGFQSVFYLVRTVVFLVAGPESDVFRTWLDTIPTSFITTLTTIVAVVVTSVLLSDRAGSVGVVASRDLALTDDDVLPELSFAYVLLGMSGRARRRGELVGVISVRIDDLPAISTAFGTEAAASVADAFRTVVRRFAPTSAFVGQDGPTGLFVGIQPGSPAEARRTAERIRRGLFDELSGVVGAVIPVVGVGVTLSDTTGYEPAALMRGARRAATDAAHAAEAAVVVTS
ncbi:hypothetical protein ACFC3F_02695 [Microbacterium sp. NPDC055910]|uniref:hypothetical protein n=1 Tax=Microbacterium sp. NPDC055910 TaxID=3345659 RepID=UPI0035D88B7C